MTDKKVFTNNDELMANALFDISKSLRLLGNGNIDHGENAIGAMEGLAMLIRDSNKEIASAINGVAEAISELATAVQDSK